MSDGGRDPRWEKIQIQDLGSGVSDKVIPFVMIKKCLVGLRAVNKKKKKKKFSWLKILTFSYGDPDPGSGMEKSGARINILDPLGASFTPMIESIVAGRRYSTKPFPLAALHTFD